MTIRKLPPRTGTGLPLRAFTDAELSTLPTLMRCVHEERLRGAHWNDQEEYEGVQPPSEDPDTPTLPEQRDGARRIALGGRFSVRAAFATHEPHDGLVHMTGDESLLEMQVGWIAEAHLNVKYVQRQVGPISWTDAKGETRQHTLDQVHHLVSGERVGAVIKPSDLTRSEEFNQMVASLRYAAVPHFCDTIRILTERSFARARALDARRYLDLARWPDSAAETAVLNVLADSAGPRPVGRVREASGFGGRAFRACLCLAAQGRIVRHGAETFGLATLVEAAKTTALAKEGAAA
ncbi:MAG: hypothetical protein AAGH90_11895 [Pseudomonadota bacterium]